jgi:uncharacterized membrane protein YeaQ/YmgE (transglycosylase-associated protein family)
MGLFSWLITGLIVGMLARLVVKGPHNLGCFGTAGLGILGSLVGGTVLNVLTGDGLSLAGSGFVGSIFGAILVLVAARLLGRNQAPSR